MFSGQQDYIWMSSCRQPRGLSQPAEVLRAPNLPATCFPGASLEQVQVQAQGPQLSTATVAPLPYRALGIVWLGTFIC